LATRRAAAKGDAILTGTIDISGTGDPVVADIDGTADRTTTGRALDIDRAKGFAIALVVWGHVPSAAMPYGPLWYYITISVIYAFHMPLFMFLSGYVFFMIGGPERFWRAPRQQLASRFDRLMIPFLFFAVLVVVGKYYAGVFGVTGDSVNSITDGIVKVMENAPDNPSISIWYLFVLFVYAVITPILWKVSRGSIIPILILGALGWVTSFPRDFYIDRIAAYFIFFGIGGLVALHRNIILPVFKRCFLAWLAVFVAICWTMFDKSYGMLVCGLACIPSIHGLFLQDIWKKDRLILFLGQNSMAIYLLNTIFIGIFAVVINRVIGLPYGYFVPAAVFLTLVGIVGPMVVRSSLAHIPVLRRWKRYLD
jgi:fucose 4-O-acetylase-like acetyltransferase